MAHSRRVYGQWQNNLPSRFINELPPAHIEICNKSTNFYGNNYREAYKHQSYDNYNEENTYGHNHTYRNSFGNVAHRPVYASLMGQKVYHESFGYGKVVAQDGSTVTVCFEHAGIKKLMSNFVQKAE